mgnify:CR=1 FL=1
MSPREKSDKLGKELVGNPYNLIKTSTGRSRSYYYNHIVVCFVAWVTTLEKNFCTRVEVAVATRMDTFSIWLKLAEVRESSSFFRLSYFGIQ